ncbi:putative methyltransferase PMT15 [Bienertia sinuspersici]
MGGLDSPSYWNWAIKNTNKHNILTLTIITFLCSFFYLLAVWQNRSSGPAYTISCITSQNFTNLGPLDFIPRHTAGYDPSTSGPSSGQVYPLCDTKYSEYTPCEDKRRSVKFTRKRLIYRERHCPNKSELLKCRVPGPYGYKSPFKWPVSRDYVWYDNVPHKHLTVEKAVQNWIRFEGDRFKFPGGGTMFPNGANAYIDDIGRLINLNDGSIRTAIDTDGVYLMEVDRVLRPGGYWILSGPPIHWKKHWKGWQRSKEDLNAEQTRIENVAKNLCWKKLIEKDDIAIWQKPINHINCKHTKVNSTPPFCPTPDPDKAWYTNLETCLTPLPKVSKDEEISGGKLANWPKRLTTIPPRISSGSINGVTPKIYLEDMKLWKRRLSFYKTVNNQLGQLGRYRNLLDMNANLGGFASALVGDPVWVMNVVPIEAKVNTLGVIYERGCEMEDILLEMDRILRPEGSVIFRDDVDILVQVKKITDALQWDSQIVNHEDGPLLREKLLFAVKSYWTAPKSIE